jgi:metal-dependent amidase/aminoacylase/carboxypeptidase family protein
MRIRSWTLAAGTVVPFAQESMGAEDFTYFVQPEPGVPGFYFQVGGTPQAAFDAAKTGGPPVPSHHSPLFKIDPEPSVRLGTEAMIVAVLDLLKPNPSAAGAN